MNEVAQHWERIDAWLQTFAPTRATYLAPGATPEELAETESALGLTLPGDFTDSYRLHNGARRGNNLLMGHFDYYPLRQIRSRNEMVHKALRNPRWAEAKPYFLIDPALRSLPVQPVWYHPHWIAFAGDDTDYLWCIDLAPASGGTWGQVIAWDHEAGPVDRLFPSFAALLSTYADQLEAGLHLGHSSFLLFPLKKVPYLQERRTAFLAPSPAKPLLHQAITYSWESGLESENKTLDTFHQVLQLAAATPEDRFFALSGLIICLDARICSAESFEHLAQLEAEAQRVEASHWIHKEIILLKSAVK